MFAKFWYHRQAHRCVGSFVKISGVLCNCISYIVCTYRISYIHSDSLSTIYTATHITSNALVHCLRMLHIIPARLKLENLYKVLQSALKVLCECVCVDVCVFALFQERERVCVCCLADALELRFAEPAAAVQRRWPDVLEFAHVHNLAHMQGYHEGVADIKFYNNPFLPSLKRDHTAVLQSLNKC